MKSEQSRSDSNRIKQLVSKYWIILIAIVFVLGFVIGNSGNSGEGQAEGEHQHTEEIDEAGNTIWTCSMHPQIRDDGPGACPICGMDLIPLEEEGGGDEEEYDPNALQMSASAAAMANVQTSVVKTEMPEKKVYLLGKVKPNEENIYTQVAHIPGRIEKLYVNFTGEKVKKGQKIASIYSPELVRAQKELFEALKDSARNPALLRAARYKLKQWKITDSQIKRLEKEGEVQTELDIYSDYNGYVFKRFVSLGDHLMQGMPMFQIIDLNKVWVMFEAYETDLPWLKNGDKVSITFQSIPGETFKGKISYIDPFINPSTRVTQVRVELKNPGTKLKPEMFANGVVEAKLKTDGPVMIVPRSSVLWTGKRAVVYIKIPNAKNPTFLYREITLGERLGDFYLVKDRLKEGEEIATNGVFRIDAAAQLAGKPSMMNPDGGKGSTGHNMADMKPGDAMGDDEEMDSGDEHSGMDMPAEKADVKYKAPDKFKEQLSEVLSSYLALKNALVSDDESSAKKEAKNMKTSIKNTNMALLKGDAHMTWMGDMNALNGDLDVLIAGKNLENTRMAFSEVSNQMAQVIDKFSLSNPDGLYLQYCPMADAYWISGEDAIRNPYYGSGMLKCGRVVKEF